ncbi:MAG: phytanoyl-CoA dioxygenase family protein [Myxococcota bacterium]|nr:phytanoyl-CoA dioxygenase family protein [Myxococcota bacterium]
MNDSRTLQPDQVATFDRDGFLVVDDFFSESELADFGAAVDLGVAGRASGDARPLEEKSLYEQSFIQCINLWEDDLAIRQFTFNADMAKMAADLLHSDAVRIWHDQALYKEAGGRETDAHQDRPFWPIDPPDQVTAWIPFDGSRRGQGAMAYLPGSHRLGLERFVDISHVFQEPYDIVNDEAVADIDPVWVEAKPGSIVFHHSLAVHLADANASEETRRVYCVIYFADGCIRRSPLPHLVPDRQGIKVDDPIRGDVSPIAWPRPEGDLPPTPTSRPPRLGFVSKNLDTGTETPPE